MLRRVGPGDHDEDLLTMTMEEVSSGTAMGKYTIEEIDAMFPDGWRALERFIHV